MLRLSNSDLTAAQVHSTPYVQSSAAGGAQGDHLELESSGASFTTLVQAVPEAVHVPGRNGYVHSGDFISHEQVLADGDGAADRAQGGMRTRMIHYFDRQKNT